MGYLYPMPKRLEFALVLAALLTWFAVFQLDDIAEFPSGIHAWTQSDHLAISYRFHKNGFDFFHPETFHYNKESHGYTKDYQSLVTSVDFPIHQYLIASIMKVSGSRSPVVFRLYVMIYQIMALIFLFYTIRLFGNNFLMSSFVMVLAMTSPIYSYYQVSMLPSMFAISGLMIGMYFLVSYWKDSHKTHFYLAMAFMTLSALNRTTYVIPIIALVGIETYGLLIKRKWVLEHWTSFLISAALVVFYFLYNSHVREIHGSAFLNSPIIPNSFDEIDQLLHQISVNWFNSYFSYFTWILIGITLLYYTFMVLFGKPRVSSLIIPFGLYLSIYFFGVVLFGFLILKQFVFHDYYFIDTLFFPTILFMGFALGKFPFPHKPIPFIFISIAMISSTAFLIDYMGKKWNERNEAKCWDGVNHSPLDFADGSTLLEDLKVPTDAKLLILEATDPNSALMQLDRTGYVNIFWTKQSMEQKLDWDYDYIVIRNDLFSRITMVEYPELIGHLNRIGGNELLTVCTFHPKFKSQTLTDLFALNIKSPSLCIMENFDGDLNEHWRSFVVSQDTSVSGSSSSLLPYDYQYGQSFSILREELGFNAKALYVSGKALKMGEQNFLVTFKQLNAEKVIECNESPLNLLIDSANKWEDFELYFHLDQFSDWSSVEIFTVNPGGNHVYFDDVNICIY